MWLPLHWASLVTRLVKKLPSVQEIQVQSPGQEDPLEKEKATHSSILAWRIPWTEEQGRLQSMGLQRVGHNCASSLVPGQMGKWPLFSFFFFIPVPLLIMVLDSLLQDQWLLSSVLTCDEVRVRRNILGSQRATYES